MSAMNPDATTMQKRVLKPKFHPTVSPDRSRAGMKRSDAIFMVSRF